MTDPTTLPALVSQLTGPLDGHLVEYEFGVPHQATWKVTRPTFTAAVAAFRGLALWPATYSDAPDPESKLWLRHSSNPDGSANSTVFTRALPGAVVPVRARRPGDHGPDAFVDCGTVPVFDPAYEAAVANLQVGGALAVTQEGLGRPRAEAEAAMAEIEALREELEAKKWALLDRQKALAAELKAKQEQLWIIELYLGVRAEVVTLREGPHAPSNTRIQVHQRVYCMDEEMACVDWLNNPVKIGQFDAEHLPDFDRWIVEQLDLYLPTRRGVAAFRVRRHRKDRGSGGGIAGALRRMHAEEADRMTYLLVRNGDAVYRLWIDVKIWPRMFQRADEFLWDGGTLPMNRFIEGEHLPVWTHDLPEDHPGLVLRRALFSLTGKASLYSVTVADFRAIPDVNLTEAGVDPEIVADLRAATQVSALRRRKEAEAAEKASQAQGKRYLAGLVAVQGLLDNGTVLGPVPFGTNVFDPTHVEERFHLVRNDEGHLALGTGDAREILTWDRYSTWLRGQVQAGRRVFWTPDRGGFYEDTLERRTGLRSVSAWPGRGPHLFEESDTHGLSFLYLPDDEVFSKDWRRPVRQRTRRVRFSAYRDECLPVDLLSWRCLEWMIRDRDARQSYGEWLPTAFRLWHLLKVESERERPFVDLALRQAGLDETHRARAERLLRWWKLRTKTNRTLSDDEPKALRMIVKALRRGDDHHDDPEVAALAAIEARARR